MPLAASDESLWQASASGDQRAFSEIYDRHAGTIYNYLFRRLADWSEAEDLTAVVFLEAFRRREDVVILDGKLVPWLYGIAANVLRNRRRALWRHRQLIARLAGESNDVVAPDVAARAEAAARMRSILTQMSRLPRLQQDGGRIAFAASTRLYVVNADGTGQRGLAGTTVAGSGKAGRMSSPAWSPDGGKILFLSDAGTSCDFCFHLYVVNADGSGERRLEHKHKTGPRCLVGDFSPAWSPDGQRIAFVRRRFDATGLDVGVVWVMRADGREQRKLTREMSFAERGVYARVAWSPDGRKLAFTSNRDGNADVYTVNSDGSGLRRLTDNPEYDGDAVWSPDGRQLVFVSNRDGGYGVYIVNADGSGHGG